MDVSEPQIRETQAQPTTKNQNIGQDLSEIS
jgi:hypothetical protein